MKYTLLLLLIQICTISITKAQMIDFELQVVAPREFHGGQAKLCLGEANQDTLVTKIINGQAIFKGKRILDTSWARVGFFKDDLYAALPLVLHGKLVKTGVLPAGERRYQPSNPIFQEDVHIVTLNAYLKQKATEQLELSRSYNYYQDQPKKRDSIRDLLLTKLRDGLKRIQQFAAEQPRNVYTLQLLSHLDNVFTIRIRADNFSEWKHTFELIDHQLQFTPTGRSVAKQISLFATVNEGGIFPNSIYTLNDGSVASLPNTGSSYAVIHFWASWCGPCIAHLPKWNALVERYHDRKINFINISVDKKPEAWKQAMQKHIVSGINGIDDPEKGQPIQKATLISYYPQYLIIDSKGTVIFNQYASNAEDQFKALDSILQKLNPKP
jgi:thiol-disulfide isomerase/thioredoxin